MNKEALQKLLKKAYEKGYKRGQEDEAIEWQKEIKKQKKEREEILTILRETYEHKYTWGTAYRKLIKII